MASVLTFRPPGCSSLMNIFQKQGKREKSLSYGTRQTHKTNTKKQQILTNKINDLLIALIHAYHSKVARGLFKGAIRRIIV